MQCNKNIQDARTMFVLMLIVLLFPANARSDEHARIRIPTNPPEIARTDPIYGRESRHVLHFQPIVPYSWMADCDQESARLGWAVAAAGDVNGDSFDDVIAGADRYDSGELDEGRAFVFHGGPGGLSAEPAWITDGNQAEAYLGWSIASAGDVNGDSFDDVIVGVPMYDDGLLLDAGRVLIFYGGPAGLSNDPDWIATGDQNEMYFGSAVAGAGDVNNDSFDDVLIGAHGYDNGQTDEGIVLLYLGGAAGLQPTPHWTRESNKADARFGGSVSGAGDVNGDSYDDFIIGSPRFTNVENLEGMAFVYHGGPDGPAVSSSWNARGNQRNARFGQSVAGAGDVNGDSFDDVVVGAPWYFLGQREEGVVFVFHGGPTGLSPSPACTLECNQDRAYIGFSVDGAGDVNGDGFADITAGAHSYDNGETNEGRIYVFYGGPTGVSTEPAWTAEADQGRAYLGHSVAGAGDVNGDSFSDIIGGSDDYDNGELDEGSVFVYHGGDDFPVAVAIRNARSRWANDHIEVTWILTESASILDLSFTVYRSEGSREDFESIAEPSILRNGDAFVLEDYAVTGGGTYYYRVIAGDHARTVASFEVECTVPVLAPALYQNVPNPFNPATTIRFDLPARSFVTLEIFRTNGTLVRTLIARIMNAGAREVTWDGKNPLGENVPSGLYFYRIRTGGVTLSRKMVLLR